MQTVVKARRMRASRPARDAGQVQGYMLGQEPRCRGALTRQANRARELRTTGTHIGPYHGREATRPAVAAVARVDLHNDESNQRSQGPQLESQPREGVTEAYRMDRRQPSDPRPSLR
jgi:hypothetical protein